MDEPRSSWKDERHPKTRLFNLAYRLNAALSSGKFNDIKIAPIRQRVEDGSILNYLQGELGIDLYSGLEVPEGYETLVVQVLQRVESHRHHSEVFIKEDGNGLSLLLAFCLEAIQESATPESY